MSLRSIKTRVYKSIGRQNVYIALVKEFSDKATNEYNNTLKEYEDVFKEYPSLMFKLSRKYMIYTKNILKYEYLIRMEEHLQEKLLKRIELAEYSNKKIKPKIF